ncbi:hypothetical protein PsAD2_00660 [Pseudovibrio axinellae]|uniref:Uncharacterized protein n=1 Tax=Pseudovibrio axinellae TaxID=989403 RepID=A0A161V8R3_9HYPH|nr:TIGR01620 family protein [Pseudovibrio axinellae]KZL21369.1 hypothetical protein PsAD2_00660 [Pseudovibrio axinellae]SEQ97721.1 putative membrane protein [Pseudovibrio axinellae]
MTSKKPHPQKPQARRAPKAFKLDDSSVRFEGEFAHEPLSSEAVVSEEEENATALPQRDIAPEPKPARSRWSRIIAIGGGGLVSLAIGLAVDSLIRDLFARYDWLGWTAVGLTALAVLGLIGLCFKEWRALSRLEQIDHIREDLQSAAETDSHKDAHLALQKLMALYSDRPETAHGRTQLKGHMQEIIDGRDLVKLAERDLLAPLDARARLIVMESAKRVSVVTALSPRALVDILIVLYENLRIVRRVSRLYGARPGTLGFWRLARDVATHLAVTGGMAAGDSLLEQFIGQGLAAKLSARLGEGLVNGFLTARIGVAAIQACRPAPFIVTKGPSLTELMSEITKSAPEDLADKD